jgi:hypothetical protein
MFLWSPCIISIPSIKSRNVQLQLY